MIFYTSKLFTRNWKSSKDIKALILLIHGLGDHSGRYEYLVKYLTKWGAHITAIDLHGHGKSSGKRGHIPSYNLVFNDISNAIIKLKKVNNTLPVFLYGHSMGGNLVINYSLRENSNINGIIASSPAIRPAFTSSTLKLMLAKILYPIYPSLTLNSGLELTGISRDKSIIEAYKNDPLVHSHVSIRLALDILKNGEWALENSQKLKIPGLILHGDKDILTDHDASKTFANKSSVCKFNSFKGGYHELHNDIDKEIVFSKITDWLSEVIA